MKKILALAILSLAAAGASAEKADAAKQTEITSDSVDFNEITQTRTLTGDVVVKKGTLLLKSDKAVLKESPEGDMHVTLTSGASRPATFRQKRDGGESLWVEGQAQRIEYDDRTSVVKLFNNAQVRQLEGSITADEIKAEFISYDSLREEFSGRNDASGETKAGKNRVTMVIAPRKPRPAPAATPAAPGTTPPPPAAPAPVKQ